MNRSEFLSLRDLTGKVINENIYFATSSNTKPNLTFDNVKLVNAQGWNIVLNGTYRPKMRGVTFNFVLSGVGPICRLCVNGTVHEPGGRYHKHDLQTEQCPSQNLPIVVPRNDLVGVSCKDVWILLCTQANIVHHGLFDPVGITA